jgi:hypothetical protein
MTRIENEIEAMDSDNRKGSPVFAVLHDYYLVPLFARCGPNDAHAFDSMAVAIERCLPNSSG